MDGRWGREKRYRKAGREEGAIYTVSDQCNILVIRLDS